MTWKKVLLVLAVLLVPYVVLCPIVNEPFYRFVMFHNRDRSAPAAFELQAVSAATGATVKALTLRSANGKSIKAWFFENPNKNSKRVFLFSHGRGGNARRYLPDVLHLLALDSSVLLYEYQGYGPSEGSASIEAICDDAVASYDYLVEKEHREPQDIVAFGQSLGTGVSGELSQRRKVAGIILHSGYTSLARVGKDQTLVLHIYPDFLFPKQVLNNVAVFSKPHPPLLIIHGKLDQLIWYRNAEDLFATAVEPKMLYTVPNGGHCAFGTPSEFNKAIKDFLVKNRL